MLTTALKDNAAVFSVPPEWIPKVFMWENFTKGLEQVQFWRRFWNTTFIAILVCIGQVLSCLSVGYALARLKFPGKKIWFYLIIGSMMIPGMVTVIPVFKLFTSLGWYNTYLPLIVPAFLGAPFQTFLARQFMSTIPKSYDEAARIDGANRLQVLTKVMMPMCKPLIAVITIQAFQGAWNDYMGPLLYVKKPDSWTLALAMGQFSKGTYGTSWNLFMAADIIYMLPILIMFFFCQKYFMEGFGSMNNTGVK
jgi:multiple sugar transport system permease protein